MGFQEPRQLLQARRPKSAGSESPKDCLVALGHQGTPQLLLAWGNQACRQQEFWGLIAGMGFWELSLVALLPAWEKPSLLAVGVLVLLPAWGNEACWLVPSVTHGAVGAMGPAYTGEPVSLVFLSEGSRSCSGREHEAPSSGVGQEAELTAGHTE
jgi:hypothetical protein